MRTLAGSRLGIALALVLCAAASHVAADPETHTLEERVAAFELDLTLTEAERSKDSHSRTCRLTIRGRDATYSGPVGESVRGRSKNGEASFALSDDEIASALSAAERAGTSDFEELRDDDEYGSRIALEAAVRDVHGTRTLRIVGMKHVSGGVAAPDGTDLDAGHGPLLSKDAKKRAGVFSSLCHQLERRANAELDLE